jgi:hypothetical protein
MGPYIQLVVQLIRVHPQKERDPLRKASLYIGEELRQIAQWALSAEIKNILPKKDCQKNHVLTNKTRFSMRRQPLKGDTTFFSSEKSLLSAAAQDGCLFYLLLAAVQCSETWV